MSFRTILVHIDDAASSKFRVDAAIRVAIAHEAQLIGMYLVRGAELGPSIAALLPPDVVERHMQDLGRAQDNAEGAFRGAAATARLDRIEWRAPAGPPIAAAVAHARCADLVVVGQRESTGSIFADELATTVLLSSGRPMLVVPYFGTRSTLGGNVLIAWDGGREATGAVADTLPFLEHAKRVDVLTIDRDSADSVEISLAEARLASWLRQHGVEVAVRRYDLPDGGIAEFLLSGVSDFGSDLIVMGGYGHTRMRELVLGGVTQSILNAMTVPVLMSH